MLATASADLTFRSGTSPRSQKRTVSPAPAAIMVRPAMVAAATE